MDELIRVKSQGVIQTDSSSGSKICPRNESLLKLLSKIV